MMQAVPGHGHESGKAVQGLGESGSPSFATIIKVLGALGLKLHVKPQS